MMERSGAEGSAVAPSADMSDTITREDHRLEGVDQGDHDRFAHYVFGKDAGAKVTEAMVTGTPVRALCGKRWVPTRDASRYPVCPECKEIKQALLSPHH